MKQRIFLDTNIVIDYLAKRMPFAEDAMRIFSLSPNRYQLCVSALSFTTIFYVLRKHFGQQQLLEMLNSLQTLVEILPVNDTIINQAILSNFQDFEDGVQYYTALVGKANNIITRNPKDFIKSNIPIYTPNEFLQVPHWMEDSGNPILNEPEMEYYKSSSN